MMDESEDTCDVARAVKMFQTILVIIQTSSVIRPSRPTKFNLKSLGEQLFQAYSCTAFLTLSIQATPCRRMESSLASDTLAATRACWIVD